MLAENPEASVAVTECTVSTDTFGTVNVAENAPRPSAVVNETVVMSKFILIALLAVKPEPVTVTIIPGEPEGGEREIEGICGGGGGGGEGELVTVKVALAEIPVESVAVMVYVPGAAGGMGNVVVNAPEGSAVAGGVHIVVRHTTMAELAVKPEPVTLVKVPAGPEVGKSVIEAVAA